MTEPHHLGPSGHIARVFQNSQLTPLLALIGVLAGIFVVIVTPKEEEPQIDVTMADITVPFPGASAREVESLISTPGEQILDEVQGSSTYIPCPARGGGDHCPVRGGRATPGGSGPAL